MSECALRARRCSVTAMSERQLAGCYLAVKMLSRSVSTAIAEGKCGKMSLFAPRRLSVCWIESTFAFRMQRRIATGRFIVFVLRRTDNCLWWLFARQRTTTKILHLFNCQFMLRSRPRHLIAPSLLSASHVAISAERFFVSADKLTWLLIKTITTARLWHWFVFITIEFQALRPMQVIEPLTGAVVNAGR